MVSNICFFQLYLGKIPILTNIFQLGWNHQLVSIWIVFIYKMIKMVQSSCRVFPPGKLRTATHRRVELDIHYQPFPRSRGLPKRNKGLITGQRFRENQWFSAKPWLYGLISGQGLPVNGVGWNFQKTMTIYWSPWTGPPGNVAHLIFWNWPEVVWLQPKSPWRHLQNSPRMAPPRHPVVTWPYVFLSVNFSAKATKGLKQKGLEPKTSSF